MEKEGKFRSAEGNAALLNCFLKQSCTLFHQKLYNA